MLLSSLIPTTVSASLPVGFQEYYVLGYEEHVWQAFLEINDNDPPNLIDGRICSTVNLVATADYQIVYYDHWEDGYEADLLNPIQSTTEVYGDGDLSNGGSDGDILSTGDAINLTSNQDVTGPTAVNGYVSVNPTRDRNDLRYDGGDRIITSGGPVNLTHAMWPLDTSWIGGAWEVYSRQAYADAYSYRLPVGENLYDLNGGDNGPYGDFRNVYLQLGAFEDNTTVSISNDTDIVNLTLDRGQTYSSMGYVNSTSAPTITINAGTVIHTNKPSQVGLITGADGSFQGRFLMMLPDRQWGADYIVPIPRGYGRGDTDGLSDAPAEVYLANPNSFPIEIQAYDAVTQTSFIISPTTTYTKATVVYSQKRGEAYIPQDSAARFTSDDGIFGVVVCADTSHVDYDWGFAGTPSKYLTQDYYVSWAPGDDNILPTDNGSPVWVTPLTNDTTFYVDFYEGSSGLDDVADEIFTLDVLEQRRIFDPDNDNTGMHIWATDKFAVTWGEDPRSADPSDPYLDLGVAMLPLQQRWLDPVLTMDKTAAPTILPSTGGTVTFTLIAQSYNTPLVNVDITDTLPINWTYVPNSTHITYPDSSIETPNPIIDDQTLFWDISTNLGFNQGLTLTFQAQITDTGSVDTSTYDGFEGIDYSSGVNWESDWQEGGDDNDPVTGTVRITSLDSPLVGSYHLRIRGNAITGSHSISRSVDLSNFTMPVLHFLRQVRSLESDDYFHLDVYDGIGWTTVLTWTNGSQEFTTIGEAVDLTPYASADSAIMFRSEDIFDEDVLFIDQVKIREGVAISVNRGEAIGKDEYSDTLFNPTDEAAVHISPLNLTKSVSNAEVQVGDTLVYTLSFINLGGSAATNVIVRDAVPTQYVTFQSVSDGGSYNGDNGITILTDTLAPGGSDTVTFTVTVNDFVEDGTLIENIAYMESDQTIKAGSNIVRTSVLAPDIEFTKLGPTVAYPGEEITYTLSYKNVGRAPATGVTIQDIIPLSTTYIPGSLSIITGTEWVELTDNGDTDQGAYISPTLVITPGIIPGAIAAGETGQIRFSVRLDSDVPLGSLIQNWATLDRDLDNPRDTNLVITRISDLLIHKRAKPTVALPGDTITYTLVYTNVSTTESQTSVYVRELIPDYTSFITITESAGNQVDYSWNNGTTWNTTRPITPVTHIRWYDAEVPTNTQVTLGFTVQVATTLPPQTVVESTAYITSNNTAANLRGWIPSNQVQVTTVDLWAEKSVNQPTAEVCSPISYTISYGNRGSADVPVQLLDTIPTDTDYITNSIWGTGAYTGGTPTLLWNAGTLAAGSAQEAGYAVVPDGSLLPGTTITNIAVLSSTYGLKTSSPVTVTILASNLAMTKFSEPSVASPGELLTYTIVISNNGLGHAVGVVVSDTLPTNTQFIPNSIALDPPSAGTVGTAPPILVSDMAIIAGQQVTVTFAVTVATPLANGTVITNTASATKICSPTPITSLVTTTIQHPVLTLTKQVGNSWSRRVKLTFTNTEQTENLVNFPVLVTLNSQRIDYNQTQDAGQDIRFVDPDGTMLAHEIEQWDENSNSYVWVKVPQINGGSNSDYIWMYYGNPDISDGQMPESVWDTSYKGVWHLAETVTDEQVGGLHFDSTQNHNTGTQNGNNDVAGMIAGGQDFDGTDDHIQITGLLGTPPDIAISAWANLTTADTDGAEIASLGDYAALRLDDSSNGAQGFFYNGSDWSTTSYPQTYAGAGWHHFVYTFDDVNNSQKLYIDGVLTASTNYTGSIVYTGLGLATFIGRHGDGKTPFDFAGIIDEVRVSSAARSADWIKAQYASMSDTFVSFDSEQDLDPPDESGIIGAPFTYTIAVTNTGYSAATQVVVTDTLPDGANYLSGGSFISSTSTVSWTIATILANDSQQVTFVVSACRPSLLNAAYRVVTSTQMVASPLGPPLLTLLTPPTVNADFDHTLPPITIDRTTYFTSTSTTNGGPVIEWTWDFGDGDTANGSTADHVYSSTGVYTVTLTVTDTCGYTDTATKTISVHAPALTVVKSAEPPIVTANEMLTYTIAVSNTGQGYATGVLVSDTLPTNTNLVAATLPYTGPVNSVVTWSLGTLGIDATRNVTMVVHVDSSAPDGTIITNTAWATCDQDVTSSDTVTTPVQTIADLTVTKSDWPDPAGISATLTYTLTVTNVGPSDAQDVYITDTLPNSVTYGGVVDAPPSLWNPTVTPPYLVWYTSTLAADASFTIAFTVTIDADATAVITNNVTVTSTTTDPTPENNRDDETTSTVSEVDFSSATYWVIEDDGATVITVTLSHPSNSPITVDYATVDGTATAGDDYIATSGTLNLAPFSIDQTFTVTITPDQIVEPDETVVLTLTGATNATVGTARNPAILTIRDDDGPAIIMGTVFSDTNGDGVRDAGEVGIPNVLITLAATSTTAITTTTDTNGSYTFSTTVTGTYTIIETDPLVNIAYIAAALDPVFYFSTTPNQVHVNVTRLGRTYQVDFGDALPNSSFASIHGTAFEDIDGDGVRDTTELGISSVTITLDGSTTTTTDLYGGYTFPVTTTGIHTVTAAEPNGYFHTTPEEVHVEVIKLGTAYPVNFGNAPITSGFATIYGTVFEDIYSDGVRDAIDLGIANVIITLDGSTTTTTDLYGGYTFSTTVAGMHTVTETDLIDHTSTTSNVVTLTMAMNNGYRVDFGDRGTCRGDPYEEDDTAGQAYEFIVGPVSQGHQFCDDTTDWVRFTAHIYTVYTITTDSAGKWADTSLALFASDVQTQPLAENDDCGWAPSNYGSGSSCIVWEAPASSDYYVRTTNQNGVIGQNTYYYLWIKGGDPLTIYLPVVARNW